MSDPITPIARLAVACLLAAVQASGCDPSAEAPALDDRGAQPAVEEVPAPPAPSVPAPRPEAPAAPPSAAPLPCPAPSLEQLGSEGPVRVNVGVAGIGTAPLLRAMPADAGGWRRIRATSHPAGETGTDQDSATATLIRATDFEELRIVDRIHDCSCGPGTGAAMLASLRPRSRDGTREDVMVGRWPAVVITEQGRNRTAAEGGGIEPASRALRLWLSDRCLIELREEPPRRSTDVLLRAARSLDIGPLEDACSARPPGWVAPRLPPLPPAAH